MVHVSEPTVLQRLDALQADINDFLVVLARSNAKRVRNTAAQILLAADGKEFMTSKCTRFRARGESDKGVMDTADALGLTPAQFIDKADMVVTRRNKAMHVVSDADELDEEVAEVASVITPALKDIAKWECAVVLNYATIKKAFPEGFQNLGFHE